MFLVLTAIYTAIDGLENISYLLLVNASCSTCLVSEYKVTFVKTQAKNNLKSLSLKNLEIDSAVR